MNIIHVLAEKINICFVLIVNRYKKKKERDMFLM